MGAERRRKNFRIDGVVNDAQLRIVNAEIELDLIAHHVGVADDRGKRRAFEQSPFPPQHIPVIGARRRQETRERTLPFGALLEPHCVYAVTGAKHVAASQPLVRLDELRPRASDSPADGITEADIAPQSADVKRIDV